MTDEEKATDLVARLQIELSKVAAIMMETKHAGFDVSFTMGGEPPYTPQVIVSKAWKNQQ